MKRFITLALAGILLLGCAGLAYGAGRVTGYYVDAAVTANQHAVGEYFNRHFGTETFGPFPVGYYAPQIDLVLNQGPVPYRFALDNFSPEEYAAFTDINRASLWQINHLTLDRLAALRVPGPVARTQQPLLFADSGSLALDAAPLLYTPMTELSKGWSVWGEGFGLFGYQAERNDSFGYVYNTGGVSLGVDKAILDKLTVGLVTGYSHSKVDFNDVFFAGKVNSLDAGLYGSYNPAPWYVDASFIWARNWHDTERFDLFANDTAHAEYYGDIFSLYTGGGYNIDIGKARITPTLSLTYTYYFQEDFTERGAGLFDLDVDAFDSHSLVSRVGLRFAYEFDLNNVTIVPEASAEWAHEYLDTDRTVISRMASSIPFVPGDTFEVSGVEPERNSAILGLGVTAYFGKGFSAYGDYNAEVREHYNSHGFIIGVRYEF